MKTFLFLCTLACFALGFIVFLFAGAMNSIPFFLMMLGAQLGTIAENQNRKQ